MLLRITVLAIFFVPSIALGEKGDRIVIEKAKRLLTVYNGERELVHYSVALGNTPEGPKRCQGDGKTPEGEYKISGRNRGSAYHRSLRISYPNHADNVNAGKLRCNPGGDIMIHGLPNGQGWIGAAHRKVDWTLGCIALTDEEIEALWEMIPDGSAVTIKP